VLQGQIEFSFSPSYPSSLNTFCRNKRCCYLEQHIKLLCDFERGKHFSAVTLVLLKYISQKPQKGLEPISYREALLSTLLHAFVYIFTQLLNALVQIENKMGLQKIKICKRCLK
jgi:hypothetical protein